MFFILLCLLGVLVLVFLYREKHYSSNYWENKGIKSFKALWLTDKVIRLVFQRVSLAETILSYYNAVPNEKCVGFVAFNNATLIIRDTELIKQITVKDFDYFTDHPKTFFVEGVDGLLDKNLFALDGDTWREMRATLSPAFTGAKIRGMFQVVNECGDQMAAFYLNEIKKLGGDSKHIELELKDSFTRFTNDVIANTAFGVKCNSFQDKNNEFYLMGRAAIKFKAWRIILLSLIPAVLNKVLKFTAIPIYVCDYFRNLVKHTTTIRKLQNIIRKDMLHLLMEAQKSTLKYENYIEYKEFAAVDESINSYGKARTLDDEDVAAQAFIFFLTSFESTSTAMCFVAYELALNPDIQQRCYDEIHEILESTDGKLSYDAVQKIKYLDMVISETLRKWPPAVATDRVCTKPYTLNVDGKDIFLEKGTNIEIPIYGIHHDPQFYPNPDKFDPERFSDENRHNIDPMTYLPFGVGPRNCIGSRFALMEIKVAMFHLIKNFEIILTNKSTVPPKLTTSTSCLGIVGGFNVGLRPRPIDHTSTYLI
ncbi:cytochrome P450 9e2-like [Chrysoperla carnea]|uniref:cytochrome P450 9e2-like n=1 Tax=Chrysoperla carnea TaxID=189513 RepID=UPI001D0709DC|nr:cytochrome P450 9e2-like [Chrysoperla carnea]